MLHPGSVEHHPKCCGVSVSAFAFGVALCGRGPFGRGCSDGHGRGRGRGRGAGRSPDRRIGRGPGRARIRDDVRCPDHRIGRVHVRALVIEGSSQDPGDPEPYR